MKGLARGSGRPCVYKDPLKMSGGGKGTEGKGILALNLHYCTIFSVLLRETGLKNRGLDALPIPATFLLASLLNTPPKPRTGEEQKIDFWSILSCFRRITRTYTSNSILYLQ